MSDLATATEHRDAWLAADTAIAVGKSYTIGNRQLTRSDSEEVKKMLTYWQSRVKSLTAAANGMKNPGVAVARWS